MNALIQFFLSVALQPTAKAVVAVVSPSLRQLQQYNLQPADLTAVLEHVAALASAKAPAYAPLGDMTADDVKDVSEALFDILKALMAQYGFTLSDAQVGTTLAAISARLKVKFPAAA